VVVDEGAVVRDSVLLHDAYVAASAVVSRAIVDERVRIEAGDEIGGGGITVVGARETVAVQRRSRKREARDALESVSESVPGSPAGT
jgi:ADP-glucose pyrophosphorylase